MHDDLIDAVKWAVEQKIAQKDKVAIMGGSYGGYATLVGPDVHARRLRLRRRYRRPVEPDHAARQRPALLVSVHAGDEAARRRLGHRRKGASSSKRARRSSSSTRSRSRCSSARERTTRA